MKKSEFRKIVREEIQKILSEETPKFYFYGYVKDNVVQFMGPEKEAVRKMKKAKQDNPNSEYSLIRSPTKKVGDSWK